MDIITFEKQLNDLRTNITKWNSQTCASTHFEWIITGHTGLVSISSLKNFNYYIFTYNGVLIYAGYSDIDCLAAIKRLKKSI